MNRSDPAAHTKKLSIWGMNGRLLAMPGPPAKKRTLVIVHGQHHSLERFHSIVLYLEQHGSVLFPDMPGFGGMDSFYSIGRTPSYDAYADYLYDVLEAHVKTDRVWLVGVSFGSQVMTRFLQKYPVWQSRVEHAVVLMGLVGAQDFQTGRFFRATVHPLAAIASTYIGASVLGFLGFNALSFHLMRRIINDTQKKTYTDPDDVRLATEIEANLWTINDHRTHAKTARMMFRDDLRNYETDKIAVSVHNIRTEDDQYFNGESVAEGLKFLYIEYSEAHVSIGQHAPSIIASKEDVEAMLPESSK